MAFKGASSSSFSSMKFLLCQQVVSVVSAVAAAVDIAACGCQHGHLDVSMEYAPGMALRQRSENCTHV